jgi:ATP/ADP translocase
MTALGWIAVGLLMGSFFGLFASVPATFEKRSVMHLFFTGVFLLIGLILYLIHPTPESAATLFPLYTSWVIGRILMIEIRASLS